MSAGRRTSDGNSISEYIKKCKYLEIPTPLRKNILCICYNIHNAH